MARKKYEIQLIPLLRQAVDSFVTHPLIFLPFATIAFIQLLVLEILYFAPRYPLAAFFNPLVAAKWGVAFTHYPNNLLILPKLFQYLQVPIYVLISSFFVAAAVRIIVVINDGKEASFRTACREALAQYVHVIFGVFIPVGILFGFTKLYGMAVDRALQISSVEGPFFIIKVIVLHGGALTNLIVGTFLTALFGFVIPAVMIEKKGILAALGINFRYLWRSFFVVFMVVFLPSLIYIPVLLLRSNIGLIAKNSFPEIQALVLVASVLVMMFIDAIIMTAMTTYYLVKKEHSCAR